MNVSTSQLGKSALDTDVSRVHLPARGVAGWLVSVSVLLGLGRAFPGRRTNFPRNSEAAAGRAGGLARRQWLIR